MRAHRAGFTLVEALVASAVFVIVLVAIVNVVLLFLKGPLNQVGEKEVYNEVAYFLEEALQGIPSDAVDYDAYGGTISNPESKLNLYYPQAPTAFPVEVSLSGGQIWVTTPEDGTVPYTGQDIVVTNLEFYIYPEADPLDPTNGIHEQPMVFIRIDAEHATDDTVETQTFQSAVTTKYYER